MKKNNLLITILFMLYILLPVCDILLSIVNYDLILISYDAFATVLAIVSLGITILVMLAKEKDITRLSKIFAMLLPVVHMVNWLCYIWHEGGVAMTLSMIVCFACSVVICIGYARPVVFKILPVVLAVLMILPLCVFYFAGTVVESTVVETAYSPSCRYYSEVIDNDQGALGGNTYVRVYDTKGTLDLFIIKLARKSETVYTGEWGEYIDMTVYWQNGDVLHVGNKKYTFDGE